MSIADRKARDKENLKTLIIQGAKKLFLEKGIEETTIRNIADEIDYSVGTIYVYYKDKNAILYDLHVIGFKELGKSLAALFTIQDPMERLRMLVMHYMKFALENSEMYDLMFNAKAPMEFIENSTPLEFIKDSTPDDWNEGIGTFSTLKNTVDECIEQGHFKGHSGEPLSFMIWSLAHGMCCLDIRQRVKGVKFSNPEKIVFDGFNEFSKILEKL